MKVVENVVFYFIIIEFTMDTPAICDPCQILYITKTSVSWCMECEEELCPECTEHHAALKATRNHHVVDLKHNKHIVSLVKKSSLVCEQHQYWDVEYFCVDHDEI
jgi:hypothetical protein